MPSPTKTSFEQVSGAVIPKIAELLQTSVLVKNEWGTVVASSDANHNGSFLSWLRDRPSVDNLHIPFCIDGHEGEIVVGKPSNGEAISERMAQVIVQLVLNQTALVDRPSNQNGLKNKFIYDLLHGRITDEATAFLHAESLNLDFSPPRAVILIDAADYILASTDPDRTPVDEFQIQRRAQFIIGRVVGFFHLPNDTICAYIGEGQVAVLKASDTQNLDSWADNHDTAVSSSSSWANLTALKRAADALLARLPRDTETSIDIGIGRYHPGIQGLARSYQDARVALSLGRRFHGCNRVHCLDELGIAAFVGVSDEQIKVDLAIHLLSPLDHEPDLLQTLTLFFANDCNHSLTASQLSIHRNTLSYRLDKVTSLTGLDPTQFDDAVQIRLALVLRSLHAKTPVA